MKKRPDTNPHDTVTGTALAIGAGVGITVGILVSGGAGIALGVSIGAGVGIALGAAWDAAHKAG